MSVNLAYLYALSTPPHFFASRSPHHRKPTRRKSAGFSRRRALPPLPTGAGEFLRPQPPLINQGDGDLRANRSNSGELRPGEGSVQLGIPAIPARHERGLA